MKVTSAPSAVLNGAASVPPRADGYKDSATLQFLLQHQRLSHPPDGPGPGSAVPRQQGVPGRFGHAQREQGAAHSA